MSSGSSLLIPAAIVIGAYLIYQRLHGKYPDSDTFLKKHHFASNIIPNRIIGAVALQNIGHSPLCSHWFHLAGQLMVVTDASIGFGYETAKELVLRGATVIITSLDEIKGKEAVTNIQRELSQQSTGDQTGAIRHMPLNYSDFKSVAKLTKQIEMEYGNMKINTLIQNADYIPTSYSATSGGIEMTVSYNTIGPYLLMRRLHEHNQLDDNSRILFTSSEYYAVAKDISTHFNYTSPRYNDMAYARSKLGVHWLVSETLNKYPNLWINLVHPGFIKSSNSSSESNSRSILSWIPDYFKINDKEASQTIMVCAMAPKGLLTNGGYYSNSHGLMKLNAKDKAMDKENAAKLWNEIEKIINPFLHF